MKSSIKTILITTVFILLCPLPGHGQPVDIENNGSGEDLIRTAKEIMNAVNTCVLITLDEDGAPRARIMDPFPPEDDLTVWFGTNPESRKVDQIRSDPRVTLFYQDSDESGYVVIQGSAVLINDPEEKEQHWKPEWTGFYPNRPDDYLLIRVSPERMELVSYSRGLVGDPVTWEPPSVRFE